MTVISRRTYPQLTEQTTVQDTDLLATYRGIGPLKKITVANFLANRLKVDGSNIGSDGPTLLNNINAPNKTGSNFSAPSGSTPGGERAFARALENRDERPEFYGAVGNGTTDDRAALALADAAGPVVLSQNYRVASNITLSSPVRFVGSGRLTPDSGVTITFAQQPNAPNRQIFYGEGAIAGLGPSKAIWFAGDAEGDIGVDSQPLLQKAANAAVAEGVVEFGSGDVYYMTGATPVTFSKAQSVICEGSCAIQYTSRTSNVFKFTTGSYIRLEGFDISTTNALWSTAGKVIDVDNVSYFKWSNLTIRDAYDGLTILNGVGHKGTNFEIFEAMNIGFGLQGVNDVFIDQFEISAPVDYFTVSTRTGTFTPGETLNVSGSPVGIFTENINTTTIKGYILAANPSVGATLVGASSGATAVIVSQTTPYALGGIRLFGKVEAFIAADGDIIGGQYSMTTDGASFAWLDCPAFNRFSNVYFDSADNGVLLDKVINTDFIGCWFSNRPGPGIFINQAYNTNFVGGEATNCWTAGVSVASGAVNTTFSGGFRAVGNSVVSSGLWPGIYIGGGTSDFIITDCVFTDNLPFGTQSFGVRVDTGSSDNYTIKDNIGTISDGGTGLNKTVYYGTDGPVLNAYVPTVTASSGTITSFSEREVYYRRDMKNIDFEIRIQIADKGTGADVLNVAMPFAAPRRVSFVGKLTTAGVGNLCVGVIDAASSTMTITAGNGASVIADTAQLTINGTYTVET